MNTRPMDGRPRLWCPRRLSASLWGQAADTGQWRGRAALLLIVVLAAATSGCAHLKQWSHNGFKVGPDYHKPAAPVAEQWIEFNDRRVIADPVLDKDWWRVFNDPALDQLMESAYRGNLPLREAGMRVVEARALRARSVGEFFPGNGRLVSSNSITSEPGAQEINGSYRHLQLSAGGNAAGVAPTARAFDLMDVGAALRWELDIWGKYRRDIERYDANLDAQVEYYDDVLVLLLAETAQAYVDIRTFQRRLELARTNVQAQEGVLRIATERERLGAADQLDVKLAETNLAETRALIPEFETKLRQANNRLCTLLGVPPRDLTEDLGSAPIPASPATIAMGIPADLMRRRPDVRYAERQVAARSAEIGIAVSDLFPQFRIEGNFGWQATNLGDLFTPQAFRGVVVAPSFKWPILHYGRIANNIREHEARFQQSALRYQETVLQANAEVEDALIAFLRAQTRTEELELAEAATAESLRLANIKFEQGESNLLPVFVLQSDLVRVQDTLTVSQAGISQALIQIYRALGGGWQIRLRAPGVPTVVEMPPVEVLETPAAEPAQDEAGDGPPALPSPDAASGAAPQPVPVADDDGSEPPKPPTQVDSDAGPADSVGGSGTQDSGGTP